VSDAEIVAAFEAGTHAAGCDGFHHADHVRVAWIDRIVLHTAARRGANSPRQTRIF